MTRKQTPQHFDPDCRRCPRLTTYLDTVKADYPTYHARPVAPFGDPKATLLIVGLAPGLHGANATGRPFTGDHAGILLYKTLFKHGFSNQPDGLQSSDGLTLRACRITNAVKCLPPANKPVAEEITQCNSFLAAEIASLKPGSVILALGHIAHNAVVKCQDLRKAVFGHGKTHALKGDRTLIDSYHCSRYNTQTRRLTPSMFDTIFTDLKRLGHFDG